MNMCKFINLSSKLIKMLKLKKKTYFLEFYNLNKNFVHLLKIGLPQIPTAISIFALNIFIGLITVSS